MPDTAPRPGEVSHPAPGVRQVLAPNPSAMTESGTRSYLVGTGAVALIDPGPDLDAHLDAVLAALNRGERISHILVTHAHLDHSGLARRLSQATGAPVLAFGSATSGRSAVMARLAAAGLTAGGEGIDHSFAPDIPLPDGAQVCGPDWQIEAIHTPGHLGGHLCFSQGDLLFSGDHVMGWASSMISPPDGCMTSYMSSLGKLRARNWRMMLPAHGPAVMDPASRLDDLTAHRLAREAAILTALATAPATVRTLTDLIYRDTPAALHGAASRNILAHLVDLNERSLIMATPEPGPAALWRLA